jgi:hypothetical protein
MYIARKIISSMRLLFTILIYCLLTYTSYSQYIVNDVIGISGDEISNPNININHTSGEIVGTTINNSEITLTQGFQQTAQILNIEPKVFLQGALFGSTNNLMRDDLRVGNYLPTISPYDNKIKVLNNAFLTSGNNAIVDWVNIELKNVNNRVIAKKSALIQKDGDIVSSNGVSPLQFTTQNSNYYLVIKHRNHFGIRSLNPITFNENSFTVDFTNTSTLAYGNFPLAQINNNTYALWAGNADGNNRIRYQGSSNDPNYIKDKILSHPNNSTNNSLFFYQDYDNADINMDGRIRYQGSQNDTNFIKDIILSHPENLTNNSLFFFLMQIPNN